jgi:hypothetical protein
MQEFTADLKHRMRGFGETLSWWTPTRTTTNWPLINPFFYDGKLPTLRLKQTES